jgi:hypothetical protein
MRDTRKLVLRLLMAAIVFAFGGPVRAQSGPPGTVPLLLYWSEQRGDNFTTATAAGQNDAQAAGYAFVRVDGYVYASQVPGTVPLLLYWSAQRGDNFTTATAAGQADAQAAGYAFVRVEGYVYPNEVPGTVPLLLFWNAQRGDNFTTAAPAGQDDAQAAGYAFVRIEGYVWPPPVAQTYAPSAPPAYAPLPPAYVQGPAPGCHSGGWTTSPMSGASLAINQISIGGAACTIRVVTPEAVRYLSIFSQPANGALSQTGPLTLVYQPNPGFRGVDHYSFGYCGPNQAGQPVCATLNYTVTVQ